MAAVHALRPVRRFNSMALLFALTLPAFPIVYVWTPPDFFILSDRLAQSPAALGMVNGLLIHLLLFCTWGEGYFAVVRPITLRILIALLKTPGGTLTLEEIRAVYGMKRMVLLRLESMRLNGYVEERDGGYVLTRKGRLLAGAILFVRRVAGIPHYFDATKDVNGGAKLSH